MAKNDGGPAFPFSEFDDQAASGQIDHPGLSKRDWFAGQAMKGSLSTFDGDTRHPASIGSNDSAEARDRRLASIAEMSYAVSDAMLAEREKGK